MMQPIPLGAFELHSMIRKGGMGEVWRGVHPGQCVPVAIKVMTGKRARHPKYLEAFRNEVESVTRLDHPGIVLIFDHGKVSHEAATLSGNRLLAGSPYLVMELAGLGALDRVRRQLRWRDLKGLLIALLDALAHAHARGVIHRDNNARRDGFSASIRTDNYLLQFEREFYPAIQISLLGDGRDRGTR